jgi:hypothetical protein
MSTVKNDNADLLDVAHGVFTDWQEIMVAGLRREGVAPARARRLGALMVAAIEGTVSMYRASHSAQPLNDVARELELALAAALAQPSLRAKRSNPARAKHAN